MSLKDLIVATINKLITVIEAQNLQKQQINLLSKRVTIADTRNENYPPSWYWANHQQSTVSDWTVSAWVKPNGGEPFELVCEVRGNHVDVTIAHESTQSATWRKAKYDVQMRHGATVKTLLCGEIGLIGDITP